MQQPYVDCCPGDDKYLSTYVMCRSIIQIWIYFIHGFGFKSDLVYPVVYHLWLLIIIPFLGAMSKFVPRNLIRAKQLKAKMYCIVMHEQFLFLLMSFSLNETALIFI